MTYLENTETNVIYKRVVAKKNKTDKKIVYFVNWINKINKRMKYLFICRCLPPDTTWHMVKSSKWG